MEIYTELNMTKEMEAELSNGRGSEPGRKTRAMSTIDAVYSDSPLVNHTHISPNCNSPRAQAIDTITIHMVWGQCTVEALGNVFAPVSRQASSNYGIGYDGRVGLYVHERDRAWTSGSTQDHRAVTIEVASDTTYPYAVTDKAYATLINLCADICRRNGKTKMVWCGSLAATNARKFESYEMRMTLHKWFQNTSCPGQYLESRMAKIADQVSSLLAPRVYPQVPFSVKVLIDDLTIRKGAGKTTKALGYAAKSNYIIDEVRNGWGYIKDKGWIYLENSEYVKIGGHIEVSPFKDVQTTDKNYKYIKKCYDAGLIGGYSNGKFKPKNKLTRGQACVIIGKLMEQLEKK